MKKNAKQNCQKHKCDNKVHVTNKNWVLQKYINYEKNFMDANS